MLSITVCAFGGFSRFPSILEISVQRTNNIVYEFTAGYNSVNYKVDKAIRDLCIVYIIQKHYYEVGLLQRFA